MGATASPRPLLFRVFAFVISLCVGLVMSFILLVMGIVKGPSSVFGRKAKPIPPACLEEPDLGTRSYIKLSVRLVKLQFTLILHGI